MFTQPSDQPLTDAELDELGELLLGSEEDDDRDDDCILGIDELHGFLTAALCAPDMIMPSEVMPRVFGDREWRSMEEAQRAMGLLMQFQNEINADLRSGDYAPLLMENSLPSGEKAIVAGDWCAGFMQGVSLRSESWLAIDSEKLRAALFPIIALAAHDPESEIVKYAEEHHDELVDQLPIAVQGIFNETRKRMNAPRRTEKVGRNESCPCGSGKKYKKCCGFGDKSELLH